jgi:hypothetical protein
MRTLIVALAIAGTAGGASAQQDVTAPGGMVRFSEPPRGAPLSARKQAEITIKGTLADPDGAKFRTEGAVVASSVKHGAFDEPIDGPVSIVCGQYSSRNPTGVYSGYSWFFVAIKHGQVLWFDVDGAADGPGAAYNGCKGAGLAN